MLNFSDSHLIYNIQFSNKIKKRGRGNMNFLDYVIGVPIMASASLLSSLFDLSKREKEMNFSSRFKENYKIQKEWVWRIQ